MTNVTLFISVLICFICHCYITHNILPIINIEIGIILLLYFYGLFTSFLNHGTKNTNLKKLDRISMKALFLINIILLSYVYYKNNNHNIIICLYCILILAGLLYYCSKTYNMKTVQNIFHICSHMSITIVNIFVIFLF
jgi:hypothetical protein